MTKGTPVFRPASPPQAAKRTRLALLAAVAVAGWIALFEREEPTADEGQPVFGVDEAEILAVEIERPGEPTVRLTRDNEGFVVAEGEGPESSADSGEVDLLLQNVGSLRFERELEGVQEEDFSEFGLAPTGLAIRVFPKGDSPEAEPLTAGFGDETPASGNRYLRLGDRVLVISAFARDNFDQSAWDLRDKRVFRLDAPAARRLRLTTGEGTAVELAREAGIWRILHPYRLAADPYEASQFASRLLDAEMAGLAADAGAAGEDPFGLNPPRLSAELELVFGPQEQAAAHTIHFGGESRTPPGVFARIEPDPLVFVVGRPLFDALHEAAGAELESLRYLRLFRFAGFRAAALRVRSPEGEFFFERRDGEEGREWTMEAGGSTPTQVDTAAVEDLLYKLNSTDAEGVDEKQLPSGGAGWTFAVTEASGDSETTAVSEPETVRLTVSESGAVRALRAGDERTLVLSGEAWGAITQLLAAARKPPEEP